MKESRPTRTLSLGFEGPRPLGAAPLQNGATCTVRTMSKAAARSSSIAVLRSGVIALVKTRRAKPRIVEEIEACRKNREGLNFTHYVTLT